jgi:hypothetical protein
LEWPVVVKILTAECSLDFKSGRRYQKSIRERIKRWILP